MRPFCRLFPASDGARRSITEDLRPRSAPFIRAFALFFPSPLLFFPCSLASRTAGSGVLAMRDRVPVAELCLPGAWIPTCPPERVGERGATFYAGPLHSSMMASKARVHLRARGLFLAAPFGLKGGQQGQPDNPNGRVAVSIAMDQLSMLSIMSKRSTSMRASTSVGTCASMAVMVTVALCSRLPIVASLDVVLGSALGHHDDLGIVPTGRSCRSCRPVNDPA